MSEVAATIINQIEETRADIIRLYRSVPVTKLLVNDMPNGWSVKDLLGHFAAWEAWLAARLNEAHEHDEPLAPPKNRLKMNREFMQEREEWGWEEIEYDFREAHAALLAAIKQMPPARLEQEAVQQAIARDSWQRYQDHLPDLRRWHKQLRRR